MIGIESHRRYGLGNQGKLPTELPPEKLLERHSSYPRNKNLAEVFYRSGFIESWGRGIRKIVDGMTNAGLPRPKIEDVDGGVRITIYRNTGVPQGVLQDVPQEFSEIQRNIFNCIKANPKISRSEIAKKCGVSMKTVGRHLAEMKQHVRFVGSGYSGHWEIVTPDGRK